MVLALSYKKRVGKDTFYEIAKNVFKDRKIVRVAFADELKNEVYELFLEPLGLSKDILNDTKYKDVVRPLMQGWGSVKRELVDKDYWIKRAFEKINANDDDAIYMITDCRYLNEIKYVKENQGYCIHIVRNTGNADDSHSSEKELDNYHDLFDFTVENNSDLDEYKEKITNLMNYLLESEL